MKLFENNMTMDEKKKAMEDIAFQHNLMVGIPGLSAVTCAAAFSVARQAAKQGEIALATYFLSICEDPAGDKVMAEEDDMQ